MGSRDFEGILSLVAGRYMSDNPALPPVFRVFNRMGFRQSADGKYDINLADRLPETEYGRYAYVCGLVWSDVQRPVELSLHCYGPTLFWLNDDMVYKSGIAEEVNRSISKTVTIDLKPGWNELLLRLGCSPSGFGCLIGASRSKWSPLDVLSPFRERQGQAGWVYSEATQADAIPEKGHFASSSEAASRLQWYPKTISYNEEGDYILSWSTLRLPLAGRRIVRFSGHSFGETQLFVDGRCLFAGRSGPWQREEELAQGTHSVVVIATGDFELQASCEGKPLDWHCPHPVHGYDGDWLCIGGFRQPPAPIAQEQPSIMTIYEDGGEARYWRAGATNRWIRPYLENPAYGQWNYPVGVTLYGLLQTGRILARPDITEYAGKHLQICVSAYPYALWSGKEYGYPSVNRQLIEMNMLDDCGSCGSAVLEAGIASGDADGALVADRIAHYILNEQERKSDGAFFREQKGYFMENTLWADDLYMCVPFLVRYAGFRGNAAGLDEAARQCLLYRAYLFMPEVRLMSHVYDFKYNTPTRVPWGRGNGWTMFSLAELLTKLPKKHPSYDAVAAFFLEMSLGVLQVQGESGMWHQVLTDADSYEETSCTAMFVYALARGIRLGLFADPAKYAHAVESGWLALTEKSIDQYGNVYGVCQGSRYSFSADYYKHDLPWRTNDTHGIGVVLLAGAEVARLHKEGN